MNKTSGHSGDNYDEWIEITKQKLKVTLPSPTIVSEIQFIPDCSLKGKRISNVIKA